MIDVFKPYIDLLRGLRLRPTKQRLAICKALFGRKNTMHFTIKQLKKIVENNTKNKISLATVYNTIYSFNKNGYLKEIPLKGKETFFDTNTQNHHHFYDEDSGKLFDIKHEDLYIHKLPIIPEGKKIKKIEVIIKIASDN